MNPSFIKTEAQLNAMPNKEVVDLYNALGEELKPQVEPVRRFADKATGVTRTLKLINLYKKQAKDEPAPAAKKAAANGTTSRPRRGTNLIPLGHEPQACREGSKQAMLLDMLRRPKGATMPELIEALSGGNKPWTEATVRSGFGWDLKNKGYGVRSEFDALGVERFHLIVPEGQLIPPHAAARKATKKKA